MYSSKDGELADFVMAKRGTQTGRVPSAYLEPMDDWELTTVELC